MRYDFRSGRNCFRCCTTNMRQQCIPYISSWCGEWSVFEP